MKFRTTLRLFDATNTGIEVPEDVLAGLGRGRRVPVLATVNGYTYRTSVAPYAGMILMPFSKEHRQATGLSGGEEIEVELVPDDAPREVVIPEDLAAAFEDAPEAAAFFTGLSYTNRRAYVTWIEEAKRPETRAARIEKAIAMLGQRKTR